MTDKNTLYFPPEIWDLITKHFDLCKREEQIKIENEKLLNRKLYLNDYALNIKGQIELYSQAIKDLNKMIDEENSRF